MATSSLTSLGLPLLSVDLSPLVCYDGLEGSFNALRLMLMILGCFCIYQKKINNILFLENIKAPFFQPNFPPQSILPTQSLINHNNHRQQFLRLYHIS